MFLFCMDKKKIGREMMKIDAILLWVTSHDTWLNGDVRNASDGLIAVEKERLHFD